MRTSAVFLVLKNCVLFSAYGDREKSIGQNYNCKVLIRSRNAGEKRLAAGGCLQACTGKDRVSFHTGGAPICAQAR